ncbi:MAG: hypothetical protein P4M12_11005 [Gammaproteobacteria bacterium]|nr:hypothetical protein [Gammaproteobacteria bacterium]
MPFPEILFSKSHSKIIRQQTINNLKNWIETQSISSIKKAILNAVIQYAQERFCKRSIAIKRLFKKTNNNRMMMCEIIYKNANESDQAFLLCVKNEIQKIQEKNSTIKTTLIKIVEEYENELRTKKQTIIALPPLQEPIMPPTDKIVLIDSVDLMIEKFEKCNNKLSHSDQESITDNSIALFTLMAIGSFIDASLLSQVSSAMTFSTCCLAIDFMLNPVREKLSSDQQKHLSLLFDRYKSLTQDGITSTHNPEVIKILRVIAPYVSIKELTHWTNDKPIPSNQLALASPEFINIITPASQDEIKQNTPVTYYFNRCCTLFNFANYGLSTHENQDITHFKALS